MNNQRNKTAIKTEKLFGVTVKLTHTDEVFKFNEASNDMTISMLMSKLELVVGIPKNLQRVRYLDDCDLLGSSTIRQNDIVRGAQLSMSVWSMWESLVIAVATNNIEEVFKLGVTKNSTYTTPNLEYMMPVKRRAHLAERAFVATFIASHRGHSKMIERLVAEGANINAKTLLGRTDLQAAAAQGHGKILDLLLNQGAEIEAEDEFGKTAMSTAEKFGNKACERHLFLYRWQQRAKNVQSSAFVPLFAHQYYDSAQPTWFRGPYQQMYNRNILPPGEFESTLLSAKKRPEFQGYGKPPLRRNKFSAGSGDGDDDWSEESDYEDSEEGHLPRIDENGASIVGSSAKRRTKKSKKRNAAYESWLKRKEAEDQARLLIRKERNQMKKDEERKKEMEKQAEEWKRVEDLKAKAAEKSYDKWLSDQQDSTSKTKVGSKSGQTPLKSTHDIIRNLLARKELEGGYHGVPFEIWTADREPHMYNRIKVHGNILLEHYNAKGKCCERK